MATGDVTIAIRDDGFSFDCTIEGFSSGATYDFGGGAVLGQGTGNNSRALAKVLFTVTSMGFDNTGTATTRTRTVYGVMCMRKVYSDQTVADETASGGNMTFRGLLSEPIYIKDNTGAGNSGTAVKVTMAAGVITNTGGASQTSNALTNATVTNNSTQTYPPLTQAAWASFPFEKAATAPLVEACFLHKFAQQGEQVACVKFDATDAHSNSAAQQVVTASTLSTQDTDSLTDWRVQVYAANIPLTALTQGDLCQVRCRAYPWIGDSSCVLDSQANGTSPIGTSAFTNSTFLCDKAGTYGVAYAIVDAVSGNDGTGAASATLATADAARFATITAAAPAIKAYNNANFGRNTTDGGIIYVVGSVGAPTTFAAGSACWLSVLPHPTEGSAAKIDSGTFFQSVTGLWRFGVELATSTSLMMLAGQYFFDGCSNINISGSEPLGNGSTLWLRNSTVQAIVLGGGGDPAFFQQARGVSGNLAISWNAPVLGCDGVVPGGLILFSSCFNVTGNAGTRYMGMVILERTGSDPSALFETSTANISDLVIHHPIFAGNRWNHENALDTQSVNWTAFGWDVRYGLICARGNHRTDIRNQWPGSTGFWPVDNSNGFSFNWNEGFVFTGDQDFWGMGSGGNNGFTAIAAGYVTDASSTGTNVGNGDYHFASSASAAAAITIPAGERVYKWDIEGNAIQDDGTGYIGAFAGQSFAPPAPTITLDLSTSVNPGQSAAGTLTIGGASYVGNGSVTLTSSAGGTITSGASVGMGTLTLTTVTAGATITFGVLEITSGSDLVEADATFPDSSTDSDSASVTVSTPATPTGLAATVTGTTTINASADGTVGDTLDFYVDGVLNASVLLTGTTGSVTLSGLTPNHAYAITVRDRDAYGNRSAATSAVNKTTWRALVVTATKAGADVTVGVADAGESDNYKVYKRGVLLQAGLALGDFPYMDVGGGSHAGMYTIKGFTAGAVQEAQGVAGYGSDGGIGFGLTLGI